MASVEERMKILKMIEEGKLSAEEGTKLLAALNVKRPTSSRAPGMPGSAKWLRIRVTDTRTGRSKASDQIPIALVDAGWKIGAHFAPEVLLAHGVNVIIDATASRRAYRDFARTLMPDLLEVSIECPLQV